jgi:hypothetical protein
MSKTNCQTIQRELDEVMLGEDCSSDALKHLNECPQCLDFHQKQTKLRQIVGSLGTVSAPPDFDFRLRSRLARENSVAGFHLNRTAWSFGQRSVAATMALVVIFGAVMMVRYVSNRDAEPQTASENKGTTPPAAPVNPGQNEQVVNTVPSSGIVETTATQPAADKQRRVGSREPKRVLSTVDSASTQASVIKLDQPGNDEVFPIDAAQQSLKVSLFDSQGNPRTISVPTVSFGSKRVLPVTTQFAPKGSW